MSDLLQVLPLVTFAAFAIPLSVIDARRHILPNRLVLIGLLCTLATEGLISLHIDTSSAFTQSLMIALKTLCVYICLVVASRGQLGMGDVKFSTVTGLTVGWVCPRMWLSSIWLAFCLAAIWLAFSTLQGARERQSVIPFGPFMSASVILCAAFG